MCRRHTFSVWSASVRGVSNDARGPCKACFVGWDWGVNISQKDVQQLIEDRFLPLVRINAPIPHNTLCEVYRMIDDRLTENDAMKYEIAEELGLIDKVKQHGWKRA